MLVLIRLDAKETREAIADYVTKRNPKTLGKRVVAETNVRLTNEGEAEITLPSGVEKDHE